MISKIKIDSKAIIVIIIIVAVIIILYKKDTEIIGGRSLKGLYNDATKSVIPQGTQMKNLATGEIQEVGNLYTDQVPKGWVLI